MTREELLVSIDELVELPPGTLKGPEELENLENWNSMALIGFMALADDNGVKLSPRQIAPCRTIDDLLALLKS